MEKKNIFPWRERKAISKKINFTLIVSVQKANPGGDPLRGNLPRTYFTGVGYMTDVSIKRKIRNRLMDMGYKVLYQAEDRVEDDIYSLASRLEAEEAVKALLCNNKDLKDMKGPKRNRAIKEKVLESFTDTGLFGSVVTKKGKSKGDGTGVSVGITGAATIHPADSIGPIDIESARITKSMNSEDEEKKGSDTFGWRHFVPYGIYVIKGSVNPLEARRNRVTSEDVAALKKALSTLFEGDASSARPAGSMTIERMYWWEQDVAGDVTDASDRRYYTDADVFESIVLKPKTKDGHIRSWEDLDIIEKELPGLTPEMVIKRK